MRFVLRMKNRGSEEAEIAGRSRNIQRASERKRFTGVDRLRAREFLQIALDQIGDAQENARSVCCWSFRPGREGVLRSDHCQLDVARVAIRHLRVGLAGRWLDVVEIFAADRL